MQAEKHRKSSAARECACGHCSLPMACSRHRLLHHPHSFDYCFLTRNHTTTRPSLVRMMVGSQRHQMMGTSRPALAGAPSPARRSARRRPLQLQCPLHRSGRSSGSGALKLVVSDRLANGTHTDRRTQGERESHSVPLPVSPPLPPLLVSLSLPLSRFSRDPRKKLINYFFTNIYTRIYAI